MSGERDMEMLFIIFLIERYLSSNFMAKVLFLI